jgi:hypothetical protein
MRIVTIRLIGPAGGPGCPRRLDRNAGRPGRQTGPVQVCRDLGCGVPNVEPHRSARSKAGL